MLLTENGSKIAKHMLYECVQIITFYFIVHFKFNRTLKSKLQSYQLSNRLGTKLILKTKLGSMKWQLKKWGSSGLSKVSKLPPDEKNHLTEDAGDRSGRALTSPGAAVWGSAPLRERARSVEPGLRGQGRAGHTILVQPKSTAASSPGWARLLRGRPRGQA